MKKSLVEKIAEIKEILEKEDITRQEINCSVEYCVALRIRNGKGVKEASADRLLSKIRKVRIKRKKESKKCSKNIFRRKRN